MLDLCGWERFGEGVGDHVIGGAENKVDLAIVDYPADEVKAYSGSKNCPNVCMFFTKRDGPQ